MKLTHINKDGEATMVDVSHKAVTQRVARARGFIAMSAQSLALVAQGGHRKGDVLAVARVAGIFAAKKTAELIPLCHPLALSSVEITFDLDRQRGGIEATAQCKLAGQTGVEMEAITAVSVALVTIYDMCKAVDKSMVIGDIRLLEKSGGKSGDWRYDDNHSS